MDYTWVALALLSAFSLATSDALAKRSLEGSNEYLAAWSRLVFSLPLLLPVLFLAPIPPLDAVFFQAYFIALPVELLTVILYMKALKESSLGMTVPFLALTPVFLIFFSYLILGEKVSMTGAAGILLIASGSYFLNLGRLKQGVLEPVKAIKRDRGALYMICVALLYAVTSSMGKMAIEHSSPLFFGAVYFVGLNIAFIPVGFIKGGPDLKKYVSSGHYKKQIIPGLFYGVMVLSHMAAMKLTKVAYMISVKRSSLLIGILYGYVLFREDNIRDRFLGGAMMFAGFVLVVTAR